MLSRGSSALGRIAARGTAMITGAAMDVITGLAAAPAVHASPSADRGPAVGTV